MPRATAGPLDRRPVADQPAHDHRMIELVNVRRKRGGVDFHDGGDRRFRSQDLHSHAPAELLSCRLAPWRPARRTLPR